LLRKELIGRMQNIPNGQVGVRPTDLNAAIRKGSSKYPLKLIYNFKGFSVRPSIG
jgi:hypothetical protein